ncbi:cobalamin biosynthesis central domain-containing protein, partial [Klebsiella pneumoniae]|uniref:cobalamin biosynthesis central domain-containing protein n=1 Tax=Klebsiella pneumoniae TaxID=573 RepID=UPI003EB90B6B
NELAALDTLAFQLNARMTDFRAAVKTVNQMLVSGKRVGLWCDGEFTGALSRCDRRRVTQIRASSAGKRARSLTGINPRRS